MFCSGSRPCSRIASSCAGWMSQFEESEMKTAITILSAMALSVAAMVPTSAQIAPSPVVGPSPSAGPRIVGGIGLGALSVMARAKVVGDREKRELTSDETAQAIFRPFFWLFSGARTLRCRSVGHRTRYSNRTNVGQQFSARGQKEISRCERAKRGPLGYFSSN